VRISPDGMRIAFRAPVDGVLNLWIAPIDRIVDARPVTAVTDRNLGAAILWMRDNRHVVFFREAAGDENWRAWRVDLETGDVRPLTPGPGVTCYIQQHSRHFPSELLIAHNARVLDARRDGCDLGVRVGARVLRIRDQPIDPPTLDLVGRPRPFISSSISRAGARTRDRGATPRAL
jgi:hypothetical protein